MIYQRRNVLFSLLAASGLTWASGAIGADCSVELKAGIPSNPMGYDLKQIEIPAKCNEFTINLSNTNPMSMPKVAMGHNVMVGPEATWKKVAQASAASPQSDWAVKDPGNLGNTKMLGPGEKDSLTIKNLKKLRDAKTNLVFFCTFPGHYSVMNGKIIFK